MIPLTNIVRRRTHTPMSARECIELKKEYSVVDDERSSVSSVADVFMLQLYIHMTMSSKDHPEKGFVNDYEGVLHLGQGVYPPRMDHPLLDKNGYFIIDDDMGLLHMKRLGKDYFLVGDFHRGTENRFLAASHYGMHRVHNARMDLNNGDFEKSRIDTVAFATRRMTDAILKLMPTRSESDMLQNRVFRRPVVNTFEIIMGVARMSHAQVPDNVTVNGSKKQLFDPINPAEVYWAELNEQDARVLNFGVAPHMAMMEPQPDPKDIRDRNLNAATTTETATVGDMLADNAFRNVDTLLKEEKYARMPLWAGILIEAKDGQLGPMGEILVSEMMAESLVAPRGQGIWHDRWWDEGADLDELLDTL